MGFPEYYRTGGRSLPSAKFLKTRLEKFGRLLADYAWDFDQFIQRIRDFSSREICFYAVRADYALYVAVGPRLDTVGVWGSELHTASLVGKSSFRKTYAINEWPISVQCILGVTVSPLN